MSIEPLKKQDGRTLRAQKTYDEVHKKLINSAVYLFNNPLVSHEKVTVSQIAKHAEVSVATAYNHFPENKLDIYGSLFQLGFKDVADELNVFLETSPEPSTAITMFLDTIANKVVELGNAIRLAWFEVRDIQASGNGYRANPMMFSSLSAKIMMLSLLMILQMIFFNYSMDVHFYGYVTIQAIRSGLNIQMNGM